jgi:DnaK suppressor protein
MPAQAIRHAELEQELLAMTPSAHCCLSLTCLALRKVAALGALSVAMILSVAWSSFAPPARAQEAKSDGRGKLILTNLPPRGSKAYKDLLRLAGNEAKGQVLNLTQAEMWSMPENKIDGVVRQGASMGVKVTKLGADWNHVLKSPGAPMAMNSLQQSIMKSVEGAKETMGVGMMATPSAAVVEYALMKDHEGKNRTLPSVIVIPLDDKQSITVRRTSVNMKKDGCTWHGEVEGTGESVMLMWWKGGRFNGMFTYRGTMYTLKNMGGQAHAVVATDPGKMPPDHGSMKSKSGPSNTDVKDDPLVSRGEGALMRERDRANIKDRQDAFGGAKMPSLDASPPPDSAGPRKITPISAAQRRALAAKKVRIDVMILYTGKVASNYIETEKDLIALSIAQANQSFANSGIGNLKLNLVHTQAVDYNEGEGEHFDHLYRMVDGEGDDTDAGSLLAGPRNVTPYIAKRGEQYMNAVQLEHFRNILNGWKRDLMEEVDRTVSHMKDEAANFPDPNDRATQEEEFSLELRTRDRERKLIRKIDEALKRVEDGSYGYCLETGEEIGVKRLEARPVATLTIEAQERRERRERQYGDRDDRYR